MELIRQRLGPYPGKLVSRVFVLYAVLLFNAPLPARENSDESASYDRIQAVTVALNELEFDEALLRLNEIEDSAHPSVLLLRAFCHEMGIGQAIDSNQAFQLAARAAEKEDWEAAQFLAWQSITGNTGEPNLLMAEDWRRKISKWRKKDAHPPVLPTQIMVSAKEGYVPRYELVTPWIQKKALEMDPVAQFNLYKILMDGRSTLPNVNRAMSWLHKSAEGGYPEAASMMAFYYEHGFILQKNEAMQARYLQIAADSGDAEAQYKLGMLLIHAKSIRRDVKRAVAMLEKAVSQDHMNALYELADLLYYGDLIEMDREKAFVLYSKAAAMGHANAMYDKAWMLTYGQGVDEDKQLGIEVFIQALDAGYSQAAIKLARIYLYGWGTDRNPEIARSYARKAIEMGNDNGRRMLGECYYRVPSEQRDYEQAFLNFELCAREGDQDCQFMMGELLSGGRGIERDLEEAFTWYTLAANKGHQKAYLMTLKMKGLGWGTEQDIQQLAEFYAAALAMQTDLVERTADKLRQELSRREIAEGSVAEKLLQALQHAEDPSKRDYVKAAICDYRKQGFKEKILPGFTDQKLSAPSSKYTAREWKSFVREQIKVREQQGVSNHPPDLIESPAPRYPQALRFFNVEETVSVVMIVDRNGSVREHSYENEPLPQFKQALEEVLPYWRFIPATKNGRTISAKVRMPIPFKIREKPEP